MHLHVKFFSIMANLVRFEFSLVLRTIAVPTSLLLKLNDLTTRESSFYHSFSHFTLGTDHFYKEKMNFDFDIE
jgi:hypothetical protein